MTWCHLVWRICAREYTHTRVRRSFTPSPPLPYGACAAASDSRRGCFRCAWSPCRCCHRRYCRAVARLPTPRPREPSSPIGEIGPRQHREARRMKPERAREPADWPESCRTHADRLLAGTCVAAFVESTSPVRDCRARESARGCSGFCVCAPSQSPRRGRWLLAVVYERENRANCRPRTIGLIGVTKGVRETAASSLAWPQHLNRKSPPSLFLPVVRVFRVCVRACSRRLLTNPSRKLRVAEATISVLRGVANCIG